MKPLLIFTCSAVLLLSEPGSGNSDWSARGNTPYLPSNAFHDPTAKALHDFSFDLYSQLAQTWAEGQNAVFSPVSIYGALSILAPGLRGETRTQVERVLRMNRLVDPIEQQYTMCDAIFADSDYHQLRKAERIFVDNSTHLQKAYKKVLTDHHSSPVKKLSFRTKSNHARAKINRYVASCTDDQITELVPPGAITELTRIFIVNAISLKAQWHTPFATTLTASKNFHVSKTVQKKVPTMTESSQLCMIQWEPTGLDASILVLPFKGSALSMIFIVPNEIGDFSALEGPAAADVVRRALDERWPTQAGADFPVGPCWVQLPKFAVRHSLRDLPGALKTLGARDLFTEGVADLSGLALEEDLFVSDAVHEAWLKVDENGVEASAATGIAVGARMLPEAFAVDRPFLFVIRHEATGANVFMGRVVDPTAQTTA